VALDALLAIAHKSLCIDLHLRGVLSGDAPRAERLSAETTNLLGLFNVSSLLC
jgi:hypothetical protein